MSMSRVRVPSSFLRDPTRKTKRFHDHFSRYISSFRLRHTWVGWGGRDRLPSSRTRTSHQCFALIETRYECFVIRVCECARARARERLTMHRITEMINTNCTFGFSADPPLPDMGKRQLKRTILMSKAVTRSTSMALFSTTCPDDAKHFQIDSNKIIKNMKLSVLSSTVIVLSLLCNLYNEI